MFRDGSRKCRPYTNMNAANMSMRTSALVFFAVAGIMLAISTIVQQKDKKNCQTNLVFPWVVVLAAFVYGSFLFYSTFLSTRATNEPYSPTY